jgi:hypothetical protein
MILNSTAFYRKYGVRITGALTAPVLADISELSLPLASVYHHIEYDGIGVGPAATEPAFKDLTKAILIDNIMELTDTLGAPRRQVISPQALNKELLTRNRRLRVLKDLSSITRDPQTLLCLNYNYLFKAFKYSRSFFTEYYKWHNVFSTAVDKAVELAGASDRQQFFMVSCPTLLPSESQLQGAAESFSQAMLRLINESNGFLFLDLWKWVHEDHRKDSLLGKIPRNKLHLINFLYLVNGRWVVLNLGYLESFRQWKGEVVDKASPENLQIKGEGDLSEAALRKRLLIFMMRLMEAKSITANTTPEMDKQLDQGDMPVVEDDDEGGEEKNAVASQEEADPNQQFEDVEKLANTDDEQGETPEERKKRIEEEDRHIEETLAQLNDIRMSREIADNEDSILTAQEVMTADALSPDEAIMVECDKLDASGLMTAGEYKRYNTLSRLYKTKVSPYAKNGETIEEFVKVPKEEVALHKTQMPDSITVTDKSLNEDTLIEFNKKYIEKTLPRHVQAMTLGVQKAGYCLVNHEIERKGDIMGEFEDHTLQIAPVSGSPTTLHFKLPVIKPNGVMTANGVNYRLKLLRVDKPIRKIAPERVALTSYYGKVFVFRGRRKSTDYGEWVRAQVMLRGMDAQDKVITKVFPTTGFYPEFPAPKAYSNMSMGFREIHAKGWVLLFDYRQAAKMYPADFETQLQQGNIIFGSKGTSFLLMDKMGGVFIFTPGKKDLEPVGTIESFLEISTLGAPIDYAELNLFSESVPVGVVLAYYMGLTNLMNTLGVSPRRVDAGKRVSLNEGEYAIVFSDETLIFNRDDHMASLILGGFKEYAKAIREYAVNNFDKPAVYLNLLEANKLGVRYMREIDLLDQMFVDPITKDILEEMKEPTHFQGLLLRSAELLTHDQHKDPLDMSEQRIRGYERIAGAVYTCLVKSIRKHKATPGRANKKVELNPYEVSKLIAEDPAKTQNVEINPIQSLREVEALTFSGEGGRSKQTMATKDSRRFHPRDLGVVSENTSDSSDVGINTTLVANPNFSNTLGDTTAFETKDPKSSSVFSTAALLAPFSDRDDPKRVNFVGIQRAHAVACTGYHGPTIRTGYEQVIAHRSDQMFASTAKKPGKVTSVNEHGITVKFTDGEETTYELGRTYGSAAGLVLPQDVITDMKPGQVFEVGEPIAYNPGFFERDCLDPKRVVFKNYTLACIALLEDDLTLEDASSISPGLAEKLTTTSIKVKDVVVPFTEVLGRIMKPGEAVDHDSVLCIIQDNVTADSGAFDEKTLETLKFIDAQTPKAGTRGKIDHIEVYYHGLKEDMSASLRNIANWSDAQLKKKHEGQKKTHYTGQVDSAFRIEGEPLALEYVCIRFMIEVSVPAGVGDKAVVANQMKSVISGTMEKPMYTETGLEVMIKFGARSIDNRIVNSAPLMFTANAILVQLQKVEVDRYFA